MNIKLTRAGVCFILLILCLLLAFAITDVMYSHVAASLGVITGTFTFKNLSNQ